MNQRPQDLVFTLFGEYLLHRPEPVWVGSLISLLETFGLSEMQPVTEDELAALSPALITLCRT